MKPTLPAVVPSLAFGSANGRKLFDVAFGKKCKKLTNSAVGSPKTTNFLHFLLNRKAKSFRLKSRKFTEMRTYCLITPIPPRSSFLKEFRRVFGREGVFDGKKFFQVSVWKTLPDNFSLVHLPSELPTGEFRQSNYGPAMRWKATL
jgi:hypothetical protein